MVQIIKIVDGSRQADMLATDDNPCFECGKCCSHFRVSFYQGELQSAGGCVPDDLVERVTPFLVCMKGTNQLNKQCIGFDKELNRCGIYENRPSVCRQYTVWDEAGTPNPDCQRLRAMINVAPLTNQINPQ